MGHDDVSEFVLLLVLKLINGANRIFVHGWEKLIKYFLKKCSLPCPKSLEDGTLWCFGRTLSGHNMHITCT
jgi:hypothetical protein